MVYVGRKLSEYCHKLAKQFAVILVTGARQAGKSTLLRNIFPNHQYLSLDDLRIRTQANESTATFLDFYKSPLIIDEVQYAPDLLSYIKIIVDEKKFKDEKFQGMYILTGSQSLS